MYFVSFQKEHFNLSSTYEIEDVTEIKSVDQTTAITDTGQVYIFAEFNY